MAAKGEAYFHTELDTGLLIHLIGDTEHEQPKVGHHADLQQGHRRENTAGARQAWQHLAQCPHQNHPCRQTLHGLCLSQLVKFNSEDAFLLLLIENVFVCPCVGMCT